jgi:hypothetical protein
MEGVVAGDVVDFGGNGLARLPFGRRSAMLVTAATLGLFLDRSAAAEAAVAPVVTPVVDVKVTLLSPLELLLVASVMVSVIFMAEAAVC